MKPFPSSGGLAPGGHQGGVLAARKYGQRGIFTLRGGRCAGVSEMLLCWVGGGLHRSETCMRRIELAVMLYIALRGLQPQSNGVLGDNTILQHVGLGWVG